MGQGLFVVGEALLGEGFDGLFAMALYGGHPLFGPAGFGSSQKLGMV